MKIYFIRHGATPGNQEGRYVGRTDEELTGECRERLRNFSKQLFSPPAAIYTSPMRRCVRTAGLIFPKSVYPKAERYEVRDFRECDFGEFEYKNYMELSGNAAYQHFIDTMGRDGFPGGETSEDFKGRCTEAFREILTRELKKEALTNEERTLAFVIHGGTIMAILEAFAVPEQDYYAWQVKNLEGYRARIQSGRKNPALKLTDVVKVCIL